MQETFLLYYYVTPKTHTHTALDLLRYSIQGDGRNTVKKNSKHQIKF